ncbi:MAG TPA: acyl-CoA thioesterase [Aquificaceae bacterium]|nr:acyl-CoA thioesterase [Aquificaceae bacterium]HIQ30685.1 acyl-CoA thioesterase [Aquifex aeolicus]
MIYRRRIQFYETDAQGVVHHSNYFRLFEEARGEFLRELGFPYSKLREKGYEVVLLEASCTYKKPLFYDEEVSVLLKLANLNRFIFEFHYEVKVGEELRAEGKTKHCVLQNGGVVSLPEELKERLR